MPDLLMFTLLIVAWWWLRRSPRGAAWVNLSEYYKTPHWQRLRARKFKQAGGKCEKCKSRERLETHHITYKTLHHEKLSDLQLLCHQCHRRGAGRI